MKTFNTLTGTIAVEVWSAPTQRVTIVDGTNPNYPRGFILSSNGVQLAFSTYSAGISLSELAKLLVTRDSHLTWPPIITTQPANQSIATGSPATFTVVASSEISISGYQWQVSPSAGSGTADGTWANLTDTGVYTGSATASLVLSNVAGLTGVTYRCVVTNASGSTNSLGGTLTVT